MNHQQLLAKFATAKPSNKGSDIVDGTHLLALIDYSFRDTDDHGTIIGVDFEVVQSPVMPAGMKVRDAFWVSKSQQNGGDYEVERAMHFVNALTGNPNPNDANNFADQSAKLTAPTQPGRGLLIQCTASTKKDVPYGKRSTKRGQVRDVHERHYQHVADQSQQAAIRASLDAKYPLQAIAAPVAPPPAQAPAYPAAPHAAYGAPPAGYAPGAQTAGFNALYGAPASVPNPYAPAAVPASSTAAPAYPAAPPPGWPAGYPWPPPAR